MLLASTPADWQASKEQLDICLQQIKSNQTKEHPPDRVLGNYIPFVVRNSTDKPQTFSVVYHPFIQPNIDGDRYKAEPQQKKKSI